MTWGFEAMVANGDAAFYPGQAALLAAAILLSLACFQLLRGLYRVVAIEKGLSDVPSAPGGNFLLGHVLPLLKGTPWDIMAAWVINSPPLVCRAAPKQPSTRNLNCMQV